MEAIPGCKFDNGTNDRYAIFGRAIGQGSTASSESPGSDERKLLVARFFENLAQKVVFHTSVLDKAYDDTFPNQPKSRKLKLFYWSIRGEPQPEVWRPLKDPKEAAANSAPVNKEPAKP